MSPTVYNAPAPSPAFSMADRCCLASGIAAAALVFSSGAFAANPPTHGTDAALLTHFRTTYDGTMKGVFVWMLGAMAILLFAAAVVRAAERARRAAGRDAGVMPLFTLLTATTAVGMLVAAQAGAAATAVVGHHATDAALPRAFDEIGHMLAHLSVVPLGLFMLAGGLTLLDARVGVRWVAAAGVPLGLAMALSGTWVFLGGQSLHNAGGLTWLGLVLWLVAQSATLVWTTRRRRVEAGAAVRAEPIAA
jgi:hypothetical protein